MLDAFSIEKLKYVGSLKQGGKQSAFIRTEDGHVYTVKVGNYLGQNFGRITAITPDKLVITEVVEDTYGNWAYHNAELPLNSTQDQSNSGNSSSTNSK